MYSMKTVLYFRIDQQDFDTLRKIGFAGIEHMALESLRGSAVLPKAVKKTRIRTHATIDTHAAKLIEACAKRSKSTKTAVVEMLLRKAKSKNTKGDSL